MGEEFEAPISEAVRGGPDAVSDFVVKGNFLKLYIWMGLIYLKTHLKDRTHRYHLDKRKGEEKIADDYDWGHLHHIHSVVRSYYNGCSIEKEALGSFISLLVEIPPWGERFDYSDLYLGQSVLLRLDDTAMISVFNDSGAVQSLFWDRLKKISGAVSDIQARELLVEYAFLNINLKERPVFRTEVDLEKEESRIVASRPERPELDLESLDMRARGAMLHHTLKRVMPQIESPGFSSKEEIEEAIREGKLTFLFNDNGDFISESYIPIDKA